MTIHPDKLSIADVQGWRFLSEYYLEDRFSYRSKTPSVHGPEGLKRSGNVEVIGIFTAKEGNDIYMQDKPFISRQGLDALCSNAIRVSLTQSARGLVNHLKENKTILRVRGLVFETWRKKPFFRFNAEPIPGRVGFQISNKLPDPTTFDRRGVRGAQAEFETFIDANYVEVLGNVNEFEPDRYKEIPSLDLWQKVLNESTGDHDLSKRLEAVEGMLVEMHNVVVAAPPRWESGVECDLHVMPQQVYDAIEQNISKGSGVVFPSDPAVRGGGGGGGSRFEGQ